MTFRVYFSGTCGLLGLLVAVLLENTGVLSRDVLRQVHVVTRHGARLPLSKHSSTLVEGTPGTLTPTGEHQMYKLGKWIAAKYNQGFLPVYRPSKVHLTSSRFDRTITSANSLAIGMYSTWESRDATGERKSLFLATNNNEDCGTLPANIPVYTENVRNDVTIRAYDKCPMFLDALQRLYASEEWRQLERSSQALRTKLAQRFGESGSVLPLKDVWNAFDSIYVAKTECEATNAFEHSTAACESLPDPTMINFLSESEWRDLQDLAHAAELLKYGNSVAGVSIGHNLLKEILDTMEVDGESDGPSFYLYSAHYPTLLGLFASLGEDPSHSEVIPSYASALVLELYQTGNSKSVQLFYRTGEDLLNQTNTNVQKRFDKICAGSRCSLKDIQNLLPAGWSQNEWCELCGNKEADVCLKRIVARNKQCSAEGGREMSAVAGFACGIGVAALVFLVFICLQRRRRVRSSKCRDDMGREECDESSSKEGVHSVI